MLRDRGWPAGEVEVQIVLEPAADDGCDIVMRGDTSSGPARWPPYPPRAPLIFHRNTESNRRLAYLVECPSPAHTPGFLPRTLQFA